MYRKRMTGISAKFRNILRTQTREMQLFAGRGIPGNNNKKELFALGISWGFCVAKIITRLLRSEGKFTGTEANLLHRCYFI